MRSFPSSPYRRRALLACLSALLAATLTGEDALSQGRPGEGAATSEPNALRSTIGAATAASTRPDPVKDYLWEVYQRSTVKKDGSGEFTWKDIDAAKHAGLSMQDYTIGGIDPDFRELLFAIGQAMDAAGIEWSILSGYRDDYRQNLASGFKSHGGYSFHGGSTATGGYGHGCAIDLSSPDRLSDDTVWAWFDHHSQSYGLRRPLPATDPVHIQPLLGPGWHEKAAALRRARLAASGNAGADQSGSDVAHPTTAAEAGVSPEQWGCVRPKGQETAHSEDKPHRKSRLAEDKAGSRHANTAPTESRLQAGQHWAHRDHQDRDHQDACASRGQADTAAGRRQAGSCARRHKAPVAARRRQASARRDQTASARRREVDAATRRHQAVEACVPNMARPSRRPLRPTKRASGRRRAAPGPDFATEWVRARSAVPRGRF